MFVKSNFWLFLLAVCQDKSTDCDRYSIESCTSDWMKENCQKSCALCEGLCSSPNLNELNILYTNDMSTFQQHKNFTKWKSNETVKQQ